ncbi:TPA: hypothetical protein N0F65_002331 [Lagenidium giganteum]|uniref:Uncharacterized protein n=1 Tax=Lagenidium giganteum TaxID=4803 RepID=A0AAV2Z1I6_9STRA|nr:TPA: hypothetical protein N0F65_002331 [Lagenidium giganteum]
MRKREISDQVEWPHLLGLCRRSAIVSHPSHVCTEFKLHVVLCLSVD